MKAHTLALFSKNLLTPADKAAQREVAQQEGFVREVDEALREDQLIGAIKSYAKIGGAAIAAALLALAGWLWWGNHSASVAGEHGEQMTEALDQLDAGKVDAAQTDLTVLADKGGDGSRAAAQMLQAGIALSQNKADQAKQIYARVASDSSAPQPYRDLATIRQTALQFDSMKPEEVIAKLKPMAAPGNPWFPSAGELVGIAYLKQGHKDLAGPLFAAIAKDKDAPESLRSRGRQMAGLLGVDAIDDEVKAGGNEAAAGGNEAPTAH